MNAGTKLIQLLKLTKLNSIKVNTRNLSELKKIDSVILVGSSFVGKTTLVRAISNTATHNPKTFVSIQIPKRIVTRPQRHNDNLAENDFKSSKQFAEMVKQGNIELHWVRKMEGTRTERYGFLKTQPNTTPIYSANNAIITNQSSVWPKDILKKSLIIAIYAPEYVRKRRLFQRSPDLVKQNPQEVVYRLTDKAINICPKAHIVIKNYGQYEPKAKKHLISLIKLIAQNHLS